MAFDTLHQIRCSEPMPGATHRVLAALLDFGACANAIIDDKPHCRRELERTRQILDDAGLHSFIEDMLRRLSDLEGRRPSPFADDRQFHEARSYREAVARLWLGALAATSAGSRCIDAGILATHDDDVLELLFRIVMQCQIIDDVLDYSRDASAGLPSFLTASASLPEAIERTHQAAREYARGRNVPLSDEVLPLRAVLGIASIGARLMLRLRRFRERCVDVLRINTVVLDVATHPHRRRCAGDCSRRRRTVREKGWNDPSPRGIAVRLRDADIGFHRIDDRLSQESDRPERLRRNIDCVLRWNGAHDRPSGVVVDSLH